MQYRDGGGLNIAKRLKHSSRTGEWNCDFITIQRG